MSEFFKALEQAERDRQLAESRETSTSLGEAPTAKPADSVETEPEKMPAVETPPVVTAAGPPAPPVEARRASLFDRPEPVVPRPSPTGGRWPAQPPLGRPVPPAVKRIGPVPDPAGEAMATPIETDPPPLQTSMTRKRKGEGPVLIADADPRSVAAEAYRTLRANLEFIPSERACRNIVITSPTMSEGKSTTAANLATVAAQAGTRVCLVDADMRRPVMHKVFGVVNRGGFTRALSQAVPLSSVAVPTDIPNLSLVVAGTADGLRPAQLLNAPRLEKVLHDPGTPFDLVIFDTPPIISVADAMHLAAHCDGVVLVVRAGAIPPSVLRQAVRQIHQVKGKILGVLLNQVDLRRGEAEFYRYYRAYYGRPKRD